jgi:DNA polymerase-3 subunit delta
MPPRSTKEFLTSLKKGEFERAYYLHGPEDVLKEEGLRYLLERAVDPATRDFNLDQRSAGQLDPESVEALCNTVPMMADRRVVVIRDVEQWKRKTKARNAFLAYLERPSPDTVVVLVQGGSEETEDKELARRATSVHFSPPTAAEAERWLERRAAASGIRFAPGAVTHLLKCTGGDLGTIRLELEKLSAIAGEEPITAEQVGDLVGIRHGETIFDWRDAVMNGDAGRSVTLLERVLDQSGVSGVKLVTLLGTTLVGVGVVRAALDAKGRSARLEDVAFNALRAGRPFGLGPWKDETVRWARWAPEWPAPRLREALRAALDTDRSLKSTTLSDERALLADLVMRLTLGEKVGA